VQYLHSIGLTHGDLKDENVLVDSNYNIRIIDFGACRPLFKLGKPEQFAGTIHYAAPEVLLGHQYDAAAAEVWTLGILLYTMITGGTAFEDLDNAIRGVYRQPRYASSACVDLIQLCLEPCVEERGTIDMIANHPWIRGKLQL
jgi:serine/threonine protein kinase